MKVRFVLRFHDNTPSGGRKIVYDYANYLSEHGNDVNISFVADTPFHSRKLNRIVSVRHYFDYLKKIRTQNKLDWFKFNSKIKLEAFYSFKHIRRSDDEVLIAFDYGIALNIAEIIDNPNNCFYMIQHDEKVYYKKSVIREAWKLPMTKIVISSWLYNKVKEYDSNVFLVKNYVEKDKFYINNPIESRKNIVSMIQHPNPSKGTQIGIDALKIVKKTIPDLQVRIFGTKNPIEGLPEYFTYYKQANISTLRDKIYNQSAIYILTSYLEGWGLTATEAMACGATLVSTRNGGVDDFGFDGETALLSDPGDCQELASNIISLLSNPDRRIAMGYAGANIVSQFTFEESAALFSKIILGERC